MTQPIPFEIESTWRKALSEELHKPYMWDLFNFVEKERLLGKVPVYPPKELVFNAFYKTPFPAVKVVIVGQDPYHGPGQAHGLSFSVPAGVAPPPSLQNIFKEIQSDLGIPPPSHGCLLHWATQGVLLLNALMTVRQSEPMSHQGKGWETFTDAVIHALLEREDPLVFLLWGKAAQEKCRHVTGFTKNSRHLILTAPHPSPFSAYNGFFGCHHFSKTNEFLKNQGKSPIDWSLSSG